MISKALVVASYRTKLRELSRLGAEVFAVAPESWKESGALINFEADDDAAYTILTTRMAWNGHYHLHYYPALGRLIRAVRPDILHVDEEPYNLATYLAFCDGNDTRAQMLFFTWQNIYRRYPPPFRQFERYVYRRAAIGLAGSQDALNVLRKKGYRGAARIVPQFGVDMDQFFPCDAPLRPFTAGYLGRLVKEKGIAEVMAAFARLDPPARLIVAGDGPMQSYVDMAGAALRRQGRMERHPRVPSHDVPNLLRRLDVLMLPSRTTPRWREQYGRVLIEAMACGVAVIGSDSGEIPEVIGDAGIIVPEGDAPALAHALTRLADSPELLRELKRRGRERAVKVFSQARIAAETYAAYEEIAGQSE